MSTKPEIRPGTVLALPASNTLSHYPRISHTLCTVSRVTPTQAVAAGRFGEIRVRLDDLKVIGRDYLRAAIASDEMLAQHAAEVDEFTRFSAAVQMTDDLIDRPLHKLRLSAAQMEALAKAWTDIKAMRGA